MEKPQPWQEDTPVPYRLLALAVPVVGTATVLFDVLRKTVFLGASWNYDYPFWNFVYNPWLAVALVAVAVALTVVYPRFLDVSQRRFVISLFTVTFVTFMIALFALPLEAIVAFDVRQRGLFDAAVRLVRNRPFDLLSVYHSLPGSTPEHSEYMLHPMNSTTTHQAVADRVSGVVRETNLPLADTMAACIDRILVQKHGPASLFLLAPSLLLFGTSTEVATITSFALAALVPVVAYFTFELYFEERASRTGALLVGFTPALFIFTKQASPVPYDAFTGLYLATGTYFLLRGFKRGEGFALALGGMSLALAAMTKMTGAFVLASVVLLTAYFWHKVSDPWAQSGTLYGAYATVPLVLFAAGYNPLCQYVFTVLKIFIGGPRGSPTAANENLSNFLIARLTPIYNTRWIGVALLVFVLAYLGKVVREREFEERDVIAACLLAGVAPFLIYPIVNTGTLSRHLLPFVVPIGFAAVRGYEVLLEEGIDGILLGRIALLVTLVSLLVNI